MRIDFAQFESDAVVFAQENGVQSDQHDLLIDASITGKEAEQITAGSFAADIRLVQLGRQEILESQIAQSRVTLEQTAAFRAQFEGRLFV